MGVSEFSLSNERRKVSRSQFFLLDISASEFPPTPTPASGGNVVKLPTEMTELRAFVFAFSQYVIFFPCVCSSGFALHFSEGRRPVQEYRPSLLLQL